MIYLDSETYNELPISVGTYRYTSTCEPMLLSFAIDDGPVNVIDLTAPGGLNSLNSLAPYWRGPGALVAHNAMFDRNVMKRLGYDIPIERWHCTMAQALAHSLPGSLDALCSIFRLSEDQAKVKEGKKLVQLFCKPMPKNSKVRRATRLTHPKQWAEFVEYARMDVEAMRALHKKMPSWNYRGQEIALYHLDQRINDRGMPIDVAFAEAAIVAVGREQDRLAGEVQARTDGAVQSATQRDVLLQHVLEAYGVSLPDLQASTIERRLSDPDLPEALRELLAMRVDASSASVAKYKALARAVSEDGRLRGTIQFCGASRTGRDAGRMFQPQNLPRPTYKFAEIERFIEAAKADCADLLYPGDVMKLAASSIRSAVVAPPGRKLVVSDLANIEGRMAAWLAGETWKLDAFKEYDTILGYDEKDDPIRKGPDLYNLAYANAFKIKAADVGKGQRQIGKVMELMLQYEGGVGAFITGAATYRIDLTEMTRLAWPGIPADVKAEAEEFLRWTVKQKRSTFGLADDVFMCCDALKRLWRRAHPAISSYWRELKDAWEQAYAKPGTAIDCRAVTFRVDGAWLRIGLPSGRFLCYPSPRVEEDGSLTYMGMNQYSRKWCRLKTYGGKLFENITQAASRDVFKHGQVLAEANGFDVLLPVHDELVTESNRSIDDLRRIMSTVPEWCPGLPLAAAGFETTRYRKED